MKRLFDLLLGSAGVFFSAPLLLLIPILIWLDDSGPVLFRQSRLGKHRRPFCIFKYRSMRAGRVTRLGRWLRTTGLDELPQLFNVLRGQMSIVGPRPLTLDDVQRLKWDDEFHRCRWQHLPGITGLAQLYAGRGAKVSWLFDKIYHRRQSWRLDLLIVLITCIINVVGKQRVRAWLRRRPRKGENWSRWVNRFAHRQDKVVLPLTPVSSALPASLSRSLAIFQLGESGGGTIVQQVMRGKLFGAGMHYAEALHLFVREEHRHAEELALCVQALGGRLMKTNWTANLFVWGRRLMGVRLKVLVLLAAEVVGICFYRLLASRLPDAALRGRLQDIATEEELHLQFHSAFLRQYTGSRYGRFLFRLTWRVVTYSAAVVVTFDHYRALRDLAIPVKLAWQRWLYLVHATEAQIITSQPDYRFLREVNTRYA